MAARDPTAWPTPFHAFRYWQREALESEREVYEIVEEYYQAYGHSRLSKLRAFRDRRCQWAIGDQQWAAAQVAFWWPACQARLAEARLAEERKRLRELERHNELLEQLVEGRAA